MKIRFKKDCEVDLAVGNRGDWIVYDKETFKKDEIHDVSIVGFATSIEGPMKQYPQVEFGDGSNATFFADTFEVIEGQDEFDEAWENESA